MHGEGGELQHFPFHPLLACISVNHHFKAPNAVLRGKKTAQAIAVVVHRLVEMIVFRGMRRKDTMYVLPE